jgi:hypothetical protein
MRAEVRSPWSLVAPDSSSHYEMRIEDLWDETSILYGVRVGILTSFGDCAPIRFSAAFSEQSARVFSQLPRD